MTSSSCNDSLQFVFPLDKLLSVPSSRDSSNAFSRSGTGRWARRASRVKILVSFQFAFKSASDSPGRGINRDVQVCVDRFLAQHVPRREKFRPNPAGLVCSVSGSRDVSDVNAQASQLPRKPAEREEQSALNVRLESPIQIRGLYANINVHRFLASHSLSLLL
jgi:hypothetical protein